MTIVVDNLLTQYELQGKGRLVLLLHGWGDSSKGLASLSKPLARDYKVLAVDLPGFGVTQAPTTVWNLDNYADFLGSLLDKLDLPQPYAVIGHSNGGALAVRAIALKQLAPQRLVLMAAAGIRTGQPLKRFILKIIAKVGNVATIWLPRRYRRTLRQRLYGAAGSDMLVVPQLQETFKQTVRQDVQRDAAQLTVPTLLLFGQDDQAVPLNDGRIYQRLIKDSRLEVLPDAGHFIHLDQPARVTNHIEEFLK